MCLAVPAQVIECNWDARTATVDLAGVKKEISVMLLDTVSIGDYVLVHVGFALNVISEIEAKKTLSLFTQAEIIGATDEVHK